MPDSSLERHLKLHTLEIYEEYKMEHHLRKSLKRDKRRTNSEFQPGYKKASEEDTITSIIVLTRCHFSLYLIFSYSFCPRDFNDYNQRIQTMHVEITDKRKIRLRRKCYVTHCVFIQSFGTLSVISHSHENVFHHFFRQRKGASKCH